MGPEAVGYLISLTIVGRFLALWLGGSAADRWGRMAVLVPGLLGYAAVLGGLPLLTDPAALSVWSLMIGLATGVVGGVPTVVVADRVAPPLQGVAVGVLRTMGDIGMLLGPLVMGTLADAVQLSAPFLVAAALLGSLAWGCFRRAERPAA